ncbi:MAG: polysaccharide biosynthesis C-terminal domain-containing protein [Candidatus Eisenbacteria bacterium]|uniref:Polysaccharide biosynthesis C-terminal domain-containing protein n=1 Tax=Eiseniibacteriota bacterium TaxID=2212470 RepID=A0A948RS62_UNCEI|nr:polysaccharide biosynthesis C-terminal domain-containing protein [Candidatus Eisenbacteria bacterium]MBU1950164.1 polysaccharide biosynthesis C-terminal domain-containing protein [Candidatus Eisenbacteria bacterium]MBU2689616.1 polysaccharide biosynthesis C-terminal domain-containing protein [Candidatus Eisenbacteria bacterium]
MSFARQSVTTFATRILISFINLPVSIIIVRTLGATGQGIYSATATLTTLWVIFGLMGIDAAHTYLLAGRRASMGQIVANSLLLTAVLSIILIPGFILLAPLAVGEEASDFSRYVGLASLAIPLILVRYFLLSVFLGRRKIGTFNILHALSTLSLLAMIALFLTFLRMGPRGAVLAYVSSGLVFAVGAAVWVRRMERPDEGWDLRPSMKHFRFSIIYGLKGHFATLLSQFNYRFDMILVLRWLGTASQGYYSIAVILAEKLTHLTASVQLVLFPYVSGMDKEDANRLTPRACRHTLVWVAVTGAALILIGPIVMPILYTEDFEQALPAFRVLIPGIIALTLSKLLSSDLSGRNRRGLPTIAMAVAFALNLGLNIILIPRHGILGAAWASTSSYTLQTLLTIIFFCRVSGVPAIDLFLWRKDDYQLYGRLMRRAQSMAGRTRGHDDSDPILPGPPVDPDGPA